MIGVGAMLLLAVGCSMAPRYERPEPPVADAWPAASASTVAASAVTGEEWRAVFGDARLRAVIDTALENNRDLRVAALNVERARAWYRIRRADQWPSLNATGSGGEQRVPADLSSSGVSQTTERYDANLALASWELDFFGRLQSLKERAMQEYLASDYARASARILVVSSVAQAYLTLAADREALGLASRTLEAQREAYALVERSFQLGLVPELDLQRARTQVEAARGEVARFNQLVARDRNALDLLAGTPVADDLLPDGLSSVVPPTDLQAGVPSDVLLNRPDVLRAEAGLKAAYADIGVARAALFPRISLTAAYGTASSELDGLFGSGSEAWSYQPQVVLPIFNPQAWAALKVSKVQQDIALAQYEQAIQLAFRDVADTLAVQQSIGEQFDAQQSLVQAVDASYRLARSRYDKGLDGYLGVLDAQRALYAAEQGMVALRLQRMLNQVRLYSALAVY